MAGDSVYYAITTCHTINRDVNKTTQSKVKAINHNVKAKAMTFKAKAKAI